MEPIPSLFEDLGPRVYSVTQINEAVRRLLEEAFGEVVVQAEISGVRQQPSGHWYFTLKDASAQLSGILFRSDASRLRFQPENGISVRAFGRLGVFVRGGKYQIQVRRLEPVGMGAQDLAVRQLLAKLEAEGLLDPRRKRPLPAFPERIGLVTSPSGAAIRDLLSTLEARWPLAVCIVVPVAVQGDAAVGDLVRALELVNREEAADVLIVGRGGGSTEDLSAFNDERVVRAIVASRIPVVSAVGHEVDVTLADRVADQRAATPTAAAALVVPHQDEIRTTIRGQETRLARGLRNRLEIPRQRLRAALASYGMRRLRFLVPEHLQTLDDVLAAHVRALRRTLELHGSRLRTAQAQMTALSPRAILERGYTYCIDTKRGTLVARAAQTTPGQELRLHFADGARPARVEAGRVSVVTPEEDR